jgi:hypothetical protein
MTGLWSGKKRLGENRKSLFEIPIHAQHIIVCLAYFSLYAKGSPIFWASYTSFPLVSSTFLALGAFLFKFGNGLRFFSYPILRLIVLILVPLPLLIIFHLMFLENYILNQWQTFLLPFTSCAIAFLLILYKKHARFVLVVFLAGLTSVNVLAANNAYLVSPYIYDKCYPRKDLFLASFDGITYLDGIDIIHDNMTYLYDYNDKLGININVCERHKYRHTIYLIATSISVTLDGWKRWRNLVENDYVHPPGGPINMTAFIGQLPSDKKIVVISSLHSFEDRLSRLRTAADSQGRAITEISRRTIQRGDIAYKIAVLSAP